MLAPRKFRTQHAKRRQRIRLAVQSIVVLLMSMFALASCVWLFWQPFARVSNIEIEGVSSLSAETIRAEARIMLSGVWFGVLPQDSVLVMRPEKIAAGIGTTFPGVSSVSSERHGLTTLTLSVTERSPQALWCGDVVPPVASAPQDSSNEELWGACYFMDNESFLFSRAPVFTGDVLPRYYGPLEKAEPLGQHFLAPDEYSVWATLRQSIDELGYPLTAMLIVDEREVEAYLQNGTKLLLGRDIAPESVVAALTALTNKKLLSKEKPLEYVDLRWDDKVYYKHTLADHAQMSGEGE